MMQLRTNILSIEHFPFNLLGHIYIMISIRKRDWIIKSCKWYDRNIKPYFIKISTFLLRIFCGLGRQKWYTRILIALWCGNSRYARIEKSRFFIHTVMARYGAWRSCRIKKFISKMDVHFLYSCCLRCNWTTPSLQYL